MATIFSLRRLDDVSALANPRLIAGTIRPAVAPKMAATAAAHWRLFGGPMMLGDMIGGQRLEPAGSPFMDWAETYMVLPNADNSGLLTPYLETDAASWIVALRAPASAGTTILLGNFTGAAGDGGWGLFYASGAFKVTTYGLSYPTRTLTLPAGYVAGSWIVIGVSHAAGSRIAQVRGAAASTDTGGARVKSATRKIALGEVHYIAATGHSQFGVAGLQYHPVTLSAADLSAAMDLFAADLAEQDIVTL